MKLEKEVFSPEVIKLYLDNASPTNKMMALVSTGMVCFSLLIFLLSFLFMSINWFWFRTALVFMIPIFLYAFYIHNDMVRMVRENQENQEKELEEQE